MVKTLVLASALGALVSGTAAQSAAGPWGQCGGNGWTGPTTCQSGWVCTAVSPPWYYQCLQGSSTAGQSTSSSSSRVSSSSSSSRVSSSSSSRVSSSSSSTRSTSTSQSVSRTTTSSAVEAGGTLIPGNSYIRGVESPFFHFYLQSENGGTTPGDAILGSYTTAAQFQVTGGQLVMNPTGSSKLYGQVAQPVSGDVKLKVTWASTPATFGTFSWSGDTLLWSDPSVTRSQNNAWLGCPDSAGHVDLYVNLGPYSYNTPAGCNDQTIHAYTGPSAVP
ncbi:hypothetical protein FRC18_008680 [Serendipita sp. 400]|nr:hypothetical protein FRC18_008680 [Serendipita sp. 400]